MTGAAPARRTRVSKEEWTPLSVPPGGGPAALDRHVLARPAGWQKPRAVTVSPALDLFGGNVTDGQIDRVFAAMALAGAHEFTVRTGARERMKRWFGRSGDVLHRAFDRVGLDLDAVKWPLENVVVIVEAD